MDPKIPYIVRQGIAAAFKAVLIRATQESLHQLAERCGPQGLFAYNNIIDNQIEARGNSIAEGDTLALSISAYIFDQQAGLMANVVYRACLRVNTREVYHAATPLSILPPSRIRNRSVPTCSRYRKLTRRRL